MKLKKVMVCLLTVAIAVVGINFAAINVSAGAYETVLDMSQFDSKWQNPEGDAYLSGSTLVFPKESTADTRVISKLFAKRDDKFNTMLEFSGSLNVKQIPENGSFIIAFGLSGIEAVSGEPGNVELTFTKKGDLKLGITVYDDNGESITVLNQKSCGLSVGRAVNIKTTISCDKRLNVLISGKSVFNGSISQSGEGRIGFFQTGSCAAEVSDLQILLYQYTRPENPNIYEDFEKGTIDASCLYATMLASGYYPTGQYVTDYKGTKVLMFENIKRGYLATKYKYSNFELTFDVLRLEDMKEKNSAKTESSASESGIIISFGGEILKYGMEGFRNAADAVVLQEGKTYTTDQIAANQNTTPLILDPFKEFGRNFSVKLSVIDGQVTLSLKWLEDKNFTKIMEYNVGHQNYDGYVHVWLFNPGSLAIDNYRIENMDYKPNTVTTEFKSSVLSAKDAVYKPAKKIYAELSDTDGEKTIPWYLVIASSATVGIIAIVTCFIITKVKKKKEVQKNEDII